MQPILASRVEAGAEVPVLVWRFDRPLLAISSGPLGGGIGIRNWALNATVPMWYDRDDPDVHLTELAAGLGLGDGPGIGLLTGLDVARRVSGSDGGVSVTATVGLGLPCWAAAGDHGPASGDNPGTAGRRVPRQPVGTINIVARVPVRLSAAALVNAVTTVTEGKAQAIWQTGIEATGTCTDAVCVVCPAEGPVEQYCGPRSAWGSRLARAAHAAILDGARAWQADPSAWSGSAHSPGRSAD
ncbi:adenosylcobinamide amidohydrolase [Rugosimonospora africana]|uniref:Adenosylcobinamide amidohydrolase n=1 Tax=Rugosimonospora africana TaxID=556532 RepID=A0A8J3VT93_9ACTN|nr:adenosylcobinamide amidohydrolase [Rugosimonospora africana]